MEYQNRIEGKDSRGKFNSRELPVCCMVLIGINVLVFLIGLLQPQIGVQMREKGSFSVTYLLYHKEYYRMFTAAFLHADPEHLFNNMLLLYFCGEITEKALGKGRFLILYFGSAICGDLLSAAYEISTGNFYTSIGASGAVFGLTGALMFLVIAGRGEAAHLSMKRTLIAVFLSLYAGFTSPYVNNAAHIGGLLSGFLLAFLLGSVLHFQKER